MVMVWFNDNTPLIHAASPRANPTLTVLRIALACLAVAAFERRRVLVLVVVLVVVLGPRYRKRIRQKHGGQKYSIWPTWHSKTDFCTLPATLGTSHFAGFTQSYGQIATANGSFTVSQNRNSEENQNDFPGSAAGTNGAQIIPNG
jgi:hypothetical protein